MTTTSAGSTLVGASRRRCVTKSYSGLSMGWRLLSDSRWEHSRS